VDPDCADGSIWTCDYNHCLESSPWPTVEDPSTCGTIEPPPRPDPEPGPEVVEEADEVEAPDVAEVAEVVESEPVSPRTEDGCGGGPSGAWPGLLALIGLIALTSRGTMSRRSR
jgi:hypothetical protein